MLWRVRTSLADRPGSLARITSTCGENGLNILALQIFPDVGSVVDDVVVTFEPAGEGTLVTVAHTSVAHLEDGGAEQGWNDVMDRLVVLGQSTSSRS